MSSPERSRRRRSGEQGILGVAGLLALAVLLAACTTRRGHVSMAPPRVFEDGSTRASLAAQAKRALKAAEALSSAGIQQFSSTRDAAQARLALAATDLPAADDGTPPPVPDLPASSLSPTLPAAPVTAPGLAEYKALFGEQLRDLQDQAARVEDVRLRYLGDATVNGAQSRLYHLSLDVYVEPDRQDYFSYLWRWLDLSHGFRNYTKDHDVELTFVLPPIPDPTRSGGRALVEVVSVHPAFEAVSSLDGMANLFGAAASAAYGVPGGAAQLDLLRASEEQFAELRRHPQIRGHVVSPTEFRFTISPRRRIVDRGWFARIFTSRTKVVRLLEAQTHTLQATLVVRDADALETFKTSANRQDVARLQAVRVNKLRPEFLFPWFVYLRSTPDETALQVEGQLEARLVPSGGAAPAEGFGDACALAAFQKEVDDVAGKLLVDGRPGHVELPIATYATYHELEDPHKPFLLPFDARAEFPERLAATLDTDDDTARDVRVLRVDLDLGIVTPATGLTAAPHAGAPTEETWYELAWPGHRMHVAELSLYESRDGKPSTTSPSKLKLVRRIGGDSRAVFRLEPPPKPAAVSLAFHVRAVDGREEATVRLPTYGGPFLAETKEPPPVDPAVGPAGSLVHLLVPSKVKEGTITQVDEVRFGGKKADMATPFQNSPDGKGWAGSVYAPGDPPYPVLDVTAVVEVQATKADGSPETLTAAVRLGRFEYSYWSPAKP